MQHHFYNKCEAAQLFSTHSHQKRVNSGGSWDTEDWSDDAGHSALITGTNRILTCIKIGNLICNCSQYYCFTVFFYSFIK